MRQTTLTFPEIALSTRDGHKLRGYIGNLFREYSPLLHNHFEDGKLRYAYPLVQYKVLNRVPFIVGLGEGSELLTQLFLQVKELRIEERSFPVHHKHIHNQDVEVGVRGELFNYRFLTPWIALNQDNYQRYRQLDEGDVPAFLQVKLRNHLITFLKAMGASLDQQVMVTADLKETRVQFKNQQHSAFTGTFTTNVLVPDHIGIGKSPSRGFGTLCQVRKSVVYRKS